MFEEGYPPVSAVPTLGGERSFTGAFEGAEQDLGSLARVRTVEDDGDTIVRADN